MFLINPCVSNNRHNLHATERRSKKQYVHSRRRGKGSLSPHRLVTHEAMPAMFLVRASVATSSRFVAMKAFRRQFVSLSVFL